MTQHEELLQTVDQDYQRKGLGDSGWKEAQALTQRLKIIENQTYQASFGLERAAFDFLRTCLTFENSESAQEMLELGQVVFGLCLAYILEESEANSLTSPKKNARKAVLRNFVVLLKQAPNVASWPALTDLLTWIDL